MSFILPFLQALVLLIPRAFAQFVGRDGATVVGGDLAGVAGGGFGDIAAWIAVNMLPFVNGIAILVIVIAGMLAVVAQDEGRIGNARKVVVMAIIGIVLVNVAARITSAYLIAFNYDRGASPAGGASIIASELIGFVQFVETPVVIIAIITIIVYGVKAVVDYGGEKGADAFKKAVLSVLTGILIITIKFVVATAVVTGNPFGIITPSVRTLFTIVGFAALLAVVVIAVAGIYLIVNLADENRAQKAKGVIISVSFGLIFMIVISGLLAILIGGIF